MSQARLLAIAFIVAGALLALVSGLADQLFGARGTVFGWKQLLGLVGGIALAAVGLLLLRQGDGDYEEDEDEEYAEEGAEPVEVVEEGAARTGAVAGDATKLSATTGSERPEHTVVAAEDLRDDAPGRR